LVKISYVLYCTMLILVEAYVKNFYTKIMNIFYPPATPLLVHYVSLGYPDPIIQPPSLHPPPWEILVTGLLYTLVEIVMYCTLHIG